MMRLVVLWTDVVVWLSAFALLAGCALVWRHERLRQTWRLVLGDAGAICSAVVLAAFFGVTVADSIHVERTVPASTSAAPGAPAVWDGRTVSMLDIALARLVESRESSYSAPLAWHSFGKESQVVDGAAVREVARLRFGGAHLNDPAREHAGDVARRAGAGLAGGWVVAMLVWLGAAWASRAGGQRAAFGAALDSLLRNRTALPLRAALLTVTALCLLAGVGIALMGHYHVLGTDRTGNDVLYQALKSVRTAFVIGTLATVATLPLAVGLGLLAGYCRGWVDEVVQYLYTTLSSVPNVLLIAACVLMMQTLLDQNPDWFDSAAQRSDIRLFMLCAILGLTGWAGLCRLVRGETLKLRELEYVQAAEAFGVKPLRIMARHLFPNVLHLVLISTVLDFSALILYEAVLSYVGVGVDPAMNSFGGMINLARSEMSRDPVVWWSFASAFVFMVTLVLAANLFADGVRVAFDPRGRLFRPTRRQSTAGATT